MKVNLLLLYILFPLLLLSQNVERLEKQADVLFEKGEYAHALRLYEEVEKQIPGKGKILAHVGICHFEKGDFTKAEGFLNRSINTLGNTLPLTYLYLGKLRHSYLDFEAAIANYKLFLKNSDVEGARRRAVKDAIKRCANGMMVRRTPPLAEVINVGGAVNSEADECYPLFSPNYDDIIYFASDQEVYLGAHPNSYNIYFTEKSSKGWRVPEPLGPALNSPTNEAPLGFDDQGNHLYFFRGSTLFSGDVLVDTFKEDAMEKNLFHAEFVSPVRMWEGDCDLHFFNDSILLFSSRRAGGYGGLDIYALTHRPTGWSLPKNLGPVINSPYDERSPFLAPDGRTLYFSTNDAQRSIGGLDILRSVYLDRVHRWTPPINLGAPINSAGDEERFSLSENGIRALFSSSRKTGFGRRDIYLAYFMEKQDQQLQPSDPIAFNLTAPPIVDDNIVNQAKSPMEEIPSMLELHPLIYDNPQMPLPTKAMADLKKTAKWLKDYPQLKMIFIGYAPVGDDSLRTIRAVLKQVAAFLSGEGVPLHQIKLQATGDKFIPIKSEARHIDPFIVNPEILPIPVKVPPNEGATFQQKFLKKTMNSLVYQVQVPIKGVTTVEELLHFYPDGMVIEHPGNGQVWFALGYQLSWEAALESERAVHEVGFFDAIAVPLLNGWELNRQEAAMHLHEYPELGLFIERD